MPEEPKKEPEKTTADKMEERVMAAAEKFLGDASDNPTGILRAAGLDGTADKLDAKMKEADNGAVEVRGMLKGINNALLLLTDALGRELQRLSNEIVKLQKSDERKTRAIKRVRGLGERIQRYEDEEPEEVEGVETHELDSQPPARKRGLTPRSH